MLSDKTPRLDRSLIAVVDFPPDGGVVIQIESRSSIRLNKRESDDDGRKNPSRQKDKRTPA